MARKQGQNVPKAPSKYKNIGRIKKSLKKRDCEKRHKQQRNDKPLVQPRIFLIRI